MPTKSRHRCNQELGNGKRILKAAGRKSKSKPNMQIFMSENDYKLRLQEVLYTPEQILAKIFRKDGPQLGDQFDPLPSNAFSAGPRRSHLEENRHQKRRKLSTYASLDDETCCESSPLAQRHGNGKGPMTAHGAAVKKYGMGKGFMIQSDIPRNHGTGKGLMKGWRGTNPYARDYQYDAYNSGSVIPKKKKRAQPHPRESILTKLANRERDKRKASLRCRKAAPKKIQKRKKPCKDKCELALDDVKCIDNTEFSLLLDDEELELRELQAGPNPLSCSAHFQTSGSHGCSLCKDLLAKFPPSSVAMKLPLSIQPWASSPELVKKLFKVFHFLCTYAVTISIHSFTLDDFARSFHDKDSFLLGVVHEALLRLLLSDIDKELSRDFFSHISKNGKYLELLHSLEHRGGVIDFWKKSLNLLTWTEILRQVSTAAGFGSQLDMTRKATCNKEGNLMDKYGLSPGTLKGELFSILLTQGNSGMEVPELAKSSRIVELNLADAVHDLENLIISALSSDITLFERISLSGYRLRTHAVEKDTEDFQSDSEDGDDVSDVTGGNDANDSDYESRDTSPPKSDASKSNNNLLTVYDEIDESHPGEVWLLGLMEGEYSDLSIEEKLNALVALIGLVSSGPSINMEDPLTSCAECPSNINCYASGAKIKRSMAKLVPLGSCDLQTSSRRDIINTPEPIDSLVLMSKMDGVEKIANMTKITDQIEAEEFLHPMQSMYLGSDRRYNRYWIFLGPCDEFDPGHRRIYFESSEDGHWEMIDTKEALYTLLSSLDHRGAREARLLASLENREPVLSQMMSSTSSDSENRRLHQSELNTCREASSSPVSDVDNRLSLGEMQNELPISVSTAAVEAGKKGEKPVEKSDDSLAFDARIWKSFYSDLNSVKYGRKSYLDTLRRCDQCQDLYWRDEKHCRHCHTTFELDFDQEERYAIHSATCRAKIDVRKCQGQRALPSQLQALKAAIYAIESAIPEDALTGSWKKSAHNLWVNRLRRVSSLKEFLQVMADFVNVVNEDWFYQENASDSYCSDEIISNFSATPQTYSAIALWLVKLDLLVASRSHAETGHSVDKALTIS